MFASLVLITFLQIEKIDFDLIQNFAIDSLSFLEIKFTGCTLLSALGIGYRRDKSNHISISHNYTNV